MLAYNPVERITIDEIFAHPWMNNSDYPTDDEINDEFSNRAAIN